MGIDCVVFDLGGVLVELGGVRDFGDMIGEPDDEQVWERWLTNTWVRDYERGLCSSETFASGMVEQFDLETSAAEFIERFRAWPRGLFAHLEGRAEYDLDAESFTSFDLMAQGVRWGRAVNNGRRDDGPSPIGFDLSLAGADSVVPPAFVDIYADWVAQPPTG